MDEETLEDMGIESAGECGSVLELGESGVIVGGESVETALLGNEPVEVRGGAEDGLENHAVGRETEFVGDAAAEMAKMPAVDDGSEVTVSKVDESLVNEEGDESVINSELEMKKEEENESQMGARSDDTLVDRQLEMEGEKGFRTVVDTDVGYEQQFSEGGFDRVKEGTETWSNGHERELGGQENVGELGGEDNADGETTTTFDVDGVAEEKGDFVPNDSEAGEAEKLTGVEKEKGDPGFIAELPVTELEIDGMKDVNGCEGNEHGDDKAVAAEESQICETKMVNGENLSIKSSSDVKVDEHLDEVECKEDVLVIADVPVGDIKTKEESRVESEGPEVVMETGINSIDSKTPEDDGKLETEDTLSDVDEPGHDMYDSPGLLQDEEDETVVADEETETRDIEMETETQDIGMEAVTDMAESGKTLGGKRKRAKLSLTKATGKASSKKLVGEDVCFICFDGGELVICDRRGCSKAYHHSCVNRDEAFFKSKGRWNCGWHMCSVCEKNARYMCYTCTFSLCKSCTKDAVVLCVRGNKGFCETCMRTVLLIENIEQGDNDAQIDFDDRGSWEYLFKDYYLELKAKLSLSPVEIEEAKNPWKGTSKIESPEVQAIANDEGSGSDDSVENSEAIRPKRRKTRKQSKSKTIKVESVHSGVASGNKVSDNFEWASRELLEFVSHMKNGNTPVLSQFDVHALLLEYIKRNKLRDSRRKSQIVCDTRLENLFGKPRVGHFEMLKLLESHFLTGDEQNDDCQGSVVDTESDRLDIDASPETLTKAVKDKKHKSRKQGDRGPMSNLDHFAAIDMHNIGLIYLRRKLMEDLLEDAETFNEKVVGTFVRIRISITNQKQDVYRLVQVVGTSKAAEPYKVGKITTDTTVEILNLVKTEIILIDTISNQEFTEDECKRLRQSIKCGLISRLTVGEILDKTTEIQVARVNDWLESETLRLSHLRDRASDLGRRKELRECVEKLQLLKTTEERRRRLEEVPEIHADPKMDPGYESDDKDIENEDAEQDAVLRSRGSDFSKRGTGPISPAKDIYVKESWNGVGKSTPSRNMSSNNYSSSTGHVGEISNGSSWSSERDKPTQESSSSDKLSSATKSESTERMRTVSQPESASGVVSLPSQGSYSAGATEHAIKINESEKIWHYKDPNGKVQGPFSMVQLRKWNKSGYFPADLKIWRATEQQEDSVLLLNALAGKFPRKLPAESAVPPKNTLSNSYTLAGNSVEISRTSLLQDNEMSKLNQSSSKWSENNTAKLPSPTPKRSTGWSGGEASLLSVAVQSHSVNGVVPSPTAVLPNIAAHSTNPASVLNSVVQNTNFSPTPNSQQGSLVSSVVPQHTQTTSVNEPHIAQLHANPPAAVQPVVAIVSQNLPADTQVWGSGVQTGQAQGYSWVRSNVQGSSGTFPNSGPPAGSQPDVWRPAHSSQPNMQNSTTPNAPWGVGPTDQSNIPMVARPQNPSVGWGPMQPNPNMGWVNPAQGNTNVNWRPSMPAPPPTGNTPGWAPPPGSNMQGMVPGNWNPGWASTQGWGQGPVPGNGWGPPSGNVGTPPPSVQGNANQGWAPWPGGEQSQGGGQFSGQQGGQGRDAGFGGGGRPWNRQSSFGGGGGPRRSRVGMVCPYNANGRCKKGAHCDYLHN